jgi:8-oxo-dGTP pyrophosphatase MutT (NUDIX family)
MFKFCPACASEQIAFEKGKVFRCPRCGFVYYHNTAAATGCIVSVPGSPPEGEERIMLLVRGREPARGKLDLPGGFVEPGESALAGLFRELGEETGWTPPVPAGAALEQVFTLFASFPNVYPYKNIVYNTCDLFFTVSAPGLREKDLRLEESEIAGVRFLRPREINMEAIAFDSARRALGAYLKNH